MKNRVQFVVSSAMLLCVAHQLKNDLSQSTVLSYITYHLLLTVKKLNVWPKASSSFVVLLFCHGYEYISISPLVLATECLHSQQINPMPPMVEDTETLEN